MPVNAALRSLAVDGRFSVDDAKQLQQLVQSGKVTQAEAKEAVQRYGDVMDPEAGSLLESFTGSTRNSAMSSVPAELQSKTLKRGDESADVATLQRGLMALGQKQQSVALTMPSGVDGKFGGETTKAVKAFQAQSGIAQTGIADPATLQALDAALRGERPPVAPTTPTPSGSTTVTRPTLGLQPGAAAPATTAAAATKATPEAMVEAAQGLVDGPTAKNYGVAERWINNDPRHAAPTGKPINGTATKWKCNLFAGNSMAAAGFEPPYYGNRRTGGEYPNANQLYKWSDKHAAKNGNANHVRFELKDEIRDMPNMATEDRKARLEQLFDKLAPGDMLIVDHTGTEVADGGHCRVYLGKDDAGNHKFAMAGNDSAEVRLEGTDAIMGEEHVWILKPNTPRK